ncbi:MAG: TetR/AcrR family transcriptional regulator C-terminal domain-containing protein [Raoultibacter sp.]|jgi:AcrR family transcriptional regulator
MNALNTMLLIAETFVSLCDEMPLRKISISDIVERTEKNRKTFYYHFENKDYLIIWIFRYDLGKILRERFPESTLVYEEASEDSISQFPYYITQKSGVRSLDHSEFFNCFSKTIEGRRRFYTQALLDNGPSSLRNHMYDLYLKAMRKDIDLILANRYLPNENIQFLAEFYTCAFLYYFIRKCCDQPHATDLIGSAGPFANIIHSSLEMEIKEAQLRRNL